MKTEEPTPPTIQFAAHKGSANCLPLRVRMSDFEIEGVLGEGGFGIVYIAFDHSLQRHVAIKEYMPGAMAGRAGDLAVTVRAERNQETFDAGLKSFINEARLLAQFDHPSLIKVYRFWEAHNTAYMAMRYYDGRTLKDIVRHSPELVTEAWLKFIFKQLLEALETLYRKKVLHRDISPDNIIVQANGDAVLLDFGSARQIIGDMTQGLTVILKPGYAPVEQYCEDGAMEQGAWTDIYALSAVVYFALTGEPPMTSFSRAVKDGMPSLAQRGFEGFSEKFLAAIDKGLAVQAADRPQTIDEFRKLLGIGAFVTGRPPKVRSSSRSRDDATQGGAEGDGLTTERLGPDGGDEPVSARSRTQRSGSREGEPGGSNRTRSQQQAAKGRQESDADPDVAPDAPPEWNRPKFPASLIFGAAIGIAFLIMLVNFLLDPPGEGTAVLSNRKAPSADQLVLGEGIALYGIKDYDGAIKKLSNAPEIWPNGPKASQLEALRYTAFSYCQTNRQTLCSIQFERALKIDPGFDLAPGEKGHPQWDKMFQKAKNAAAAKK